MYQDIKEELHVKNLGPLQNIHVALLPVTLITGESGAGKSLLLKVLAMMRHACKTAILQRALKKAKVKGVEKIRKEPYLKFAQIDNLYREGETEILYKLLFKGTTYTFSFDKCALRVTQTKQGKIEGDDKLPYLKIAFIADTRNLIAAWANKGPIIQEKVLDNYFSKTYELWDNAVNALLGDGGNYELGYWDLTLNLTQNAHGQAKLNLISKEGHENIFEQSASGQKSAIPVSLILRYLTTTFSYNSEIYKSYLQQVVEETLKNGTLPSKETLTTWHKVLSLLIEEPELSLDPNKQVRFADDLFAILDQANKELFINLIFTTHSPYWVMALNTILAERKSKSLRWEWISGYLIQDGVAKSLKNEELELLDAPNLDSAYKVLDARFNTALDEQEASND